MTPRAGRRAALGVLLLALVLGGALRLWRVGRDLPIELETTSAPALDAFWYLESAQAHADGSGCDDLPPYDRPLWDATARAWFAAAGTGIESSHVLGALLGTLEVLLVALALRPLGRRAAVLAALLLATSYAFGGLARTPLIYTPIATGLTAAWALWARGGRVGRGVAWGLLALLALAFKGVAVVLAPGLILGHLASGETRRRRRIFLAVLLAIGAVALVAWRIDPFGAASATRERLERYFDREIAGTGFRLPVVLAGRVLTTCWEGGLVRLAPGLLGLAALGGILAGRDRRLAPEARGVLGVAAGWAFAVIAALAVLEYRPLRWFALAAPPLAGLAGFGAARILDRAPRRRRAIGRELGWRSLVDGALVTFLVTSAFLLVRDRLSPAARLRPTPPEVLGLASAVGLGAGVFFAVRPVLGLTGVPGSGRRAPGIRRVLGLLVLAATVGLDLERAWVRFGGAGDSLVRANAAAREALGPGAVLGGPYAPVLAAGGRLERRRAAELRGGREAAVGLEVCARFRLTHVALDAAQDATGQLSSGFEKLGKAPDLIVALDVRGSAVLVYRLRDAEQKGYCLSPFERACEVLDRGDAAAAASLLAAIPERRDLCLARARALLGRGRADAARRVLAFVDASDPGRRSLEQGLDVSLQDMLEHAVTIREASAPR